jgi:hypothetical protein
MRRVIIQVERWLPLFACLSAVVVPVNQVIGDGATSDCDAPPDLDTQLHEILGFVVLQEQMWRPESRIRGPFDHWSRKPKG